MALFYQAQAVGGWLTCEAGGSRDYEDDFSGVCINGDRYAQPVIAGQRELVDGVLKGAPFERRLVARTYDGLRIEPLYPGRTDTRPISGRTPGAPWQVVQRLDHRDPKAANLQGLQDLENGANGLALVFAGSSCCSRRSRKPEAKICSSFPKALAVSTRIKTSHRVTIEEMTWSDHLPLRRRAETQRLGAV